MLNRDRSHMAYLSRVMEEGCRKRNTIQEQLITQSYAFAGLTEFFSVRYPASIEENDPEDMDKIIKAVGKRYKQFIEAFQAFNKEHKIVRRLKDLDKEDKKWLDKYFRQNVYPALVPITVDKSRKANIHSGLYIFTLTEKGDDQFIGYVEVPAGIGRFIQVDDHHFTVPVEEVIMDHLDEVIRGRKIVRACPFSIVRSSEVFIQSDKSSDPYELIKQTLKEREESWITAMEIGSKDEECRRAIKRLVPTYKSDSTLVIHTSLVRLADLGTIPDTVFKEDDRRRRFEPYVTFSPGVSTFDLIRERDRLCCHPYESYDASFVRFLQEASTDPDTMSIRITLYRVSSNSDIINALLKAADKGKSVIALIELKARFDEKHNMQIAKILREGGVRVVYTKQDIKTHAKVCLVTRKEKKGLRIYSHVGTGNYSQSNARGYVDYSYFTADREIGIDLTNFFNLLTSSQKDFKSKKIVYAPYNLKSTLVEEIDRQIKRAKDKKNAQIIVKCNAVTDEGVAKKLLEAAKAGVRVRCIVRSACILAPTKNLEIYSIVGRWLEHSRIYCFGSGKEAAIYIGSSDLMTRNLSRRNELLIQVEDKDIRKRLLGHLKLYLSDNTNRREIRDNYKYRLVKRGDHDDEVDVQEAMRKEAKALIAV